MTDEAMREAAQKTESSHLRLENIRIGETLSTRRWMKLPPNPAYSGFSELHLENDWCKCGGCSPAELCEVSEALQIAIQESSRSAHLRGRREATQWISIDDEHPPVGPWNFYDDVAPQQGGRSSIGVLGIVDGDLALVRYEELTDDYGKTVSNTAWTLMEWAEPNGQDTHQMVKPTQWLKVEFPIRAKLAEEEGR